MAITRTITVDDIDDLLPMMQQEVDNNISSYQVGRDRDRARAAGYIAGVQWSMAIIRDTTVDLGDGRGE